MHPKKPLFAIWQNWAFSQLTKELKKMIDLKTLSITKKDGKCPHLPDVWDYWDIELGKRIDNFNK